MVKFVIYAKNKLIISQKTSCISGNQRNLLLRVKCNIAYVCSRETVV